MWSIEEMKRTSDGEKWFVTGNMGVHYVDDLLPVAPDNILEETSKAVEETFTLATPERVTGEKAVTFFAAMRSQKLIKAMHWDRGSTSTTSSTNTSSTKLQESHAQRSKRDQKSLLRTSLDQFYAQPSSCAGS